ncbi:MAG: hypothetical protein FWE16_01175 [Firmicutes bacterium]|nr:hypothetical protein [Bacillota bacterium]
MEKSHDELKNKYEKHARILAAGICPMSGMANRFLSPQERIDLDIQYARILRKFTVGGTDFIDEINTPTPLTQDEAHMIAKQQLEELVNTKIAEINETAAERTRRLKERLENINQQYFDRVEKINSDAHRRGLSQSTIVLVQRENALQDKIRKEESIYAQIDHTEERRYLVTERHRITLYTRLGALAKRLHAESVRLNVIASREKSHQKSRSLRHMTHLQRTRLDISLNTQEIIDEELYAVYLQFLFAKNPRHARDLVDNDPLFFFNLSSTYFMRLLNAVEERAVMHRPGE